MSGTGDGGPAFPRPDVASEDHWQEGSSGMMLLDWFAGQALVGLLSDPNIRDDASRFAEAAYEQAAAMIRVRVRYAK